MAQFGRPPSAGGRRSLRSSRRLRTPGRRAGLPRWRAAPPRPSRKARQPTATTASRSRRRAQHTWVDRQDDGANKFPSLGHPRWLRRPRFQGRWAQPTSVRRQVRVAAVVRGVQRYQVREASSPSESMMSPFPVHLEAVTNAARVSGVLPHPAAAAGVHGKCPWASQTGRGFRCRRQKQEDDEDDANSQARQASPKPNPRIVGEQQSWPDCPMKKPQVTSRPAAPTRRAPRLTASPDGPPAW
jgi:hypothetical protein